MLAQESEASLATRRRNELAEIAREAGVYHPWLNRKDLSACLIQWRENTRRHVRVEIAKARHECIVRTAARKGLYVPPDNLSRYGLDANGRREATILGAPLSRALRTVPDAVTAARTLSMQDFCHWAKTNSDLAGRLIFFETGVLGDGGALFWREVQKAFAPPEVPPLFAGTIDAGKS
jgi:LmbE family N-acetylglucosaminyl deacetylase